MLLFSFAAVRRLAYTSNSLRTGASPVPTAEKILKMWRSGMDEMIKRIKPYAILVYGGEAEYDYKDIDVYLKD